MNVPTLKRPTRSLVQSGASGIGFVRHPTISRAGNRFTLVDGAGNNRMLSLMDEHGRVYMDVVIVDASPYPNRIYYGDGGYSEDNPRPPLCFSDNGTGPSTLSAEPQAPTCASCEWSKWGSAVSKKDGRGIPACSNKKKLAVIVLGDNNEMLYELAIPPGSFNIQPDKDPQEGGWSWYCKSLAAHKADLFQVVTRVTFQPGNLGNLLFKPVSMVEQDAVLVERANQWLGSEEAEDRIGMNDTAIDPAGFLAPAQAKPAHIEPPAQPKPVVHAMNTVITPPEAPKPRGRPPKKVEPEEQKAIPPFLNTKHGIVENPPAPPTDIQKRVGEIFKLPT